MTPSRRWTRHLDPLCNPLPLLKVAGRKLRKELEAVITSSDDYASSSKPQIDWDDPQAREALIDSRAKDAYACLGVLHGKRLDAAVTKAAELLAKVTGQDLTEGDDGMFRIARKVAKDRVISTVDPERPPRPPRPRRGSFDGFKGPRGSRPRLRDHHRNGRDAGQAWRRQCRQRPHRRPSR